MQIKGISVTHPGHKRDHNEDAVLVREDLGLYIVADGMGGHAAGEVASRVAVEAAARALEEQRAVLSAVAEGEEHFLAAVRVVDAAIRAACAEVFRVAMGDAGRHGMGTTLTLVQVVGFKAIMGHVGDSRLYLLRGDRVEQLSTDHSMVAEFVRMGVLAPDKAHLSPYYHVLTRSLGTQPSVQVDTLAFDLFPDDRLILCSDGLGDYVPEPDDLRPLLDGSGAQTTQRLLDFALQRGGEDNISAVIVDFEPDPTEELPAVSVVELSRRFEAMNSIDLFRDLALTELQRVLNACTTRDLPPQEVILREGDHASRLFILLEGSVEVRVGEHSIGHLAPGEAIGETALLSPRPSPATLLTAAPSRLLELAAEDFAELLRHRPRLGALLLQRLGQRAVVAFEQAHARLRAANIGHAGRWSHPGELF